MTAPLLFTARGGVVLFRMQPVPDWTVQQVKRAINREGLDDTLHGRGSLDKVTRRTVAKAIRTLQAVIEDAKARTAAPLAIAPQGES